MAGDGAAHDGTCWDGYKNVANVVEAKCSKPEGGGERDVAANGYFRAMPEASDPGNSLQVA